MNHRIRIRPAVPPIQQLPPKRDLINFNRCITIAVSYLSFQRIRYTHPHGTPSGYHRREQVQRHADSERIGEHSIFSSIRRRKISLPAPEPMLCKPGKKDARNGHQHVREQQSRHAPGNISSMFSRRPAPSTSSATPRRPCVRLAQTPGLASSRRSGRGRFSAGTEEEEGRRPRRYTSPANNDNNWSPNDRAAPLSPVLPQAALL